MESTPTLPSFAILHNKGAPPPQWCPRCASPDKPPHAQKKNGWTAVPGNLPDWYRRRGYTALAMCSGCMWVLVEEE